MTFIHLLYLWWDMKIPDLVITSKDKYTIHSKQCGRNKLYTSYMPRKIILGVELIYMHMNKIQASGLKSAVVKCCVSMLDVELEITVVAHDCPRPSMPWPANLGFCYRESSIGKGKVFNRFFCIVNKQQIM